MLISGVDHLVLTVRDIELTAAFYQRILGMRLVQFGAGRLALHFGSGGSEQKINLHQAGQEFEPRAVHPTPGAADLCFRSAMPLEQSLQHVRMCGVDIIEGPLQRTGALGPMTSFYFRDPDQNLIEVCHY